MTGSATFGADLTPELRGACRVLLDGEDVTNRCLEGRAGEGGWVRLFMVDDQGRKYAVDDEPATVVREGDVVVERT